MTLVLSSYVIAHHSRIPRPYTGDGDDVSPPLSWSGAPEGTRSFALICEDPDAPHRSWFHWAAFDIAAEKSSLDEGIPHDNAPGMKQGTNDFGKPGYNGPHPPHGHGVHRYHFHLYALDTDHLRLPAGVPCREVKVAAERHEIESAELVATYSR